MLLRERRALAHPDAVLAELGAGDDARVILKSELRTVVGCKEGAADAPPQHRHPVPPALLPDRVDAVARAREFQRRELLRPALGLLEEHQVRRVPVEEPLQVADPAPQVPDLSPTTPI